METWLKGLVAAACIVVIGWGGYLGWMEYQRRSQIAAEIEATKDLASLQVELKKWRAEQDVAWLKSQELMNIRSRCHNLANQMRDYQVFTQPKNTLPKGQLTLEIKKCASENRFSVEDVADMKPYL